jgi:cation diffusion facilitator family transporter
VSAGGGNKAVIAALLANLGIAVTKFVAFLLTGFASMLAEAIHSFADSGNQVLLLIGGKASRRAADEKHPFGYGRERYLYAFVVSIVLFTLGGLYSLYEAFHKFVAVAEGHTSETFDSGWRFVPLAVLGISIVLEAFSLRTAVAESQELRGDMGWWRFIREAKNPELPVVLLEDVAALMGLIFAFVAISLTLVTHNEIFDAIGTVFIGSLLLVVAVILAREMKSLLVGESGSAQSVAAVRSAIESTEGITSLIHLKTLHTGPESMLVAAKIGVAAGATGVEIAQLIDAAERRIRESEPLADLVYLEPDIQR